MSGASGGGAAERTSALFRRADAAKIFNNGGLVLVDGIIECSFAVAATQGVSGT